MTLQWLTGWWNLIYLAPFLIAITYLGLYVMTGITFGDADVDQDVDAHADGSTDAQVDAGHDLQSNLHWEPSAEVAEAAGHVGHVGDVHHHAETHGTSANDAKPAGLGAFSLVSLIGVGKVPLSIVLMILLIVWGISGFATNQLLHKTMADGDRIGLMSVPIAAAITLMMTAALTRVLGRVMPRDEANVKRLPQLVGQEGTAILPIDDRFGLAKVRDGSGVSIQVPCRVAPGQDIISANRAVVLMRFDRSERVFYVTTPDRMQSFRAAPARPSEA